VTPLLDVHGDLLIVRPPVPATCNEAGASYKSEVAHLDCSPRRAAPTTSGCRSSRRRRRRRRDPSFDKAGGGPACATPAPAEIAGDPRGWPAARLGDEIGGPCASGSDSRGVARGSRALLGEAPGV